MVAAIIKGPVHASSGDNQRAEDASSVSSTAKRPIPDEKPLKKKKGKKDNAAVEPTGHRAELQEDLAVDPTPFAFRPYELAHMLDPKSLDTLKALGGTDGLLKGLGASTEHGLGAPGTVPPAHGATLEDRRRVYGDNVLPVRISQTFLQLMWHALTDKVILLLCVAAIVSFALGLYQDFGVKSEDGEPPIKWVEGVAIMVAIALVVFGESINNWQKERQFKALNEKKEERGVKVIRNGNETIVDIKELVVGDIVLLEPGDIIPCDGIFLGGHNIKCDESGATGESDAIRKLPFEECMHLTEDAHTDCFLISGTKVLEGVGRYVAVAVGKKSFNGRIMMALRGATESTPLQSKLSYLAELIAKVGALAGFILFMAFMIRFFVELGTGVPVRTSADKINVFVNSLVISVALIAVAVPEGLPLAVTLALAFATKRMTQENLLVRVLASCETMANASVVCTDKTGTLTQNDMTVVTGTIGVRARFVRRLEENPERAAASTIPGSVTVDQTRINDVLPTPLRTLINESIAINSTAFEDTKEDGKKVFVGSKTETALLKFAQDAGWRAFREIRDTADRDIVQMIPFSSARKSMGVVLKVAEGKWRVYVKGASEILVGKCTRYAVAGQAGDELRVEDIDGAAREDTNNTITFYAGQSLRTIALCYAEFESWPPKDSHFDDQNEVDYEDITRSLILLGIVGIEDPLRPGVREAVAKCQRAGVAVKMCTGDNVLTARSIASQCGIYTPGGIVMEGPAFRQLSRNEIQEVVPRLQVLARSSPEDKKLLVETLKELGEIVGVTGDGTNDGPALKTANVGFSMGIAGTEIAKEASDIILMDDNFASIVKAIMWGRCVNDAVRKFLQFQISTNITAVFITFISAVAHGEDDPVLSAVQLLWINIIMDTFAALALATDPATEDLLERKPEGRKAPLFSVDMWKMILGQSCYQTVIILVFHFVGLGILGREYSEHNDKIVKTLVFNIFVFSQIFNSINCRRLDRRLNVFEGVHRNWWFIIITLLEVAIQIIIMFVGGLVFQVTRIPGREWGISIALGFVSIPLGAFIRCLPNRPFEAVFHAARLMSKNTEPSLPLPAHAAQDGSSATEIDAAEDLTFFSSLRNGRARDAIAKLGLKKRKAVVEGASESGDSADEKQVYVTGKHA